MAFGPLFLQMSNNQLIIIFFSVGHLSKCPSVQRCPTVFGVGHFGHFGHFGHLSKQKKGHKKGRCPRLGNG